MINEIGTDYEVVKNGKVVLDFYANWCGQCKMVAPKVEEIAGKKTDYTFYKVDADKHSALVEQYQVSNLPTFIVLENGNVTERGGLSFFLEWSNK